MIPGGGIRCFSEGRGYSSGYIILDCFVFKHRKVPAIVDTGAQFSCLLSDVVEYLHKRGERCTFSPCVFPCLKADGTKTQVNDAVKLHVRLL